MNPFDQLGFSWDLSLIPTSIPKIPTNEVRHRFYYNIPEFVYDMCFLEENLLTLSEVERAMVMAGTKLTNQSQFDQNQVVNTAKAVYHLYDLIQASYFILDKQTFCALHVLLVKEEAFEWGHFRRKDEEKQYTPLCSTWRQRSTHID